jgi:hypothetical protein
MKDKIILFLLLLFTYLIYINGEIKIYEKPILKNNNINKRETSYPPIKECKCLGIKSISFKYIYSAPKGNYELPVSNYQNHLVDIRIFGNSDPQEINNVKNENIITIFGQYIPTSGGNKHILGPNKVIIKIFEIDNLYPFEIQYLDVLSINGDCPNVIEEGTILGSIEITRVVKIQDGNDCDIKCEFNLALCIDTSGSITSPYDGGDPNNEQLIKNLLNNEIIDYLSGLNVNVAVYSFATYAYEEITYISLTSLGGINAIKNSINSIVFQTSDPTWYTNWEDAFTLIKDRSKNLRPDLLLFITDGSPTIHINSPFVFGDYGDDIIAGLNAANNLKSNNITKIIPIGIGSNIDSSNLQAIASHKEGNGPIINKDYFLISNFSKLRDTLRKTVPFICCKEDRDICGLCYGNNNTCDGCDGIPNSNKEFDICGICGGDGNCGLPPCNHDFNVTIIEETSFDIKLFDYGDIFELSYHTNYLPGTTIVLSFEPYTNKSNIRYIGSCGLPQLNYHNSLNNNNDDDDDYCDLFTIELPTGRWTKHVNESSYKVYYKSNFTLYELLDCKDSNGNKNLIEVSDDRNHYIGYIYGTLIKPNNCNNEYEPKSETILFQTHYKFEIWKNKNGVLSSLIMTYPIKFESKWTRNIWLQSGDVIVEFKTFINHLSQDSELIDYNQNYNNTYLGNPEIIVSDETGIPFQLVYTNISCTDINDSDHLIESFGNINDKICKQIWQIRTYNSIGVLDFSGYKPIRFTVYVNGYPRSTIKLNLHLTIKRTNDPKIDNLLGPKLEIYHDKEFKLPYNPHNHYNNSFIDCSYIYSLISFHNKSVELHIDKIFLCTGKCGNPLPYDPSYPHITGCNTPGIDIITITLYDKKSNYYNQFYKFQFLDELCNLSEIKFKYEARAISEFKQLLQVHWNAKIIDNYSNNNNNNKLYQSLLNSNEKQFNGVSQPFIGINFEKKKNEINKILTDQITNHNSFNFPYPKHFYMIPISLLLEQENEKLQNNLNPYEDPFGYDYIPLLPHQTTNFVPYYVSCPISYNWYNGQCVYEYNFYDHFRGNGYGNPSNFFAFVFIILVIIGIFTFYCIYSTPDDIQTYGNPSVGRDNTIHKSDHHDPCYNQNNYLSPHVVHNRKNIDHHHHHKLNNEDLALY